MVSSLRRMHHHGSLKKDRIARHRCSCCVIGLLLVLIATVLRMPQVQATKQHVTNPTSLSPSDLSVSRIPRGGGLFFGQRKNDSQAYRHALEEQLLWLNQQIRQVQDSKQLLKRQETKRSQHLTDKEQRKEQQAATKAWKEQMKELELQLAGLMEGKQAMEDLIAEQEAQIQVLQAKCQDEQAHRTSLQASYDKELETLEQSWQQRSLVKVQELEQVLETRIAKAQEKARQEVWKQETEKVNQATAQLTQSFCVALQEEQQKTVKALQQQKQKLRSLAKSMATRERHLLQQQAKSNLKGQQAKASQTKVLQAQQLAQEKLEVERKRQAEKAKQLMKERKEQAEKAKQAREARRKERQEKAKQLKQLKEQPVKTSKPAVDPKSTQTVKKPQYPAAADRPGVVVLPNTSSSSKSKQKTARHKVECWQRRVMWQPMSLPPSDVTKV